MRRLETVQTVAKNSAACSVEISPDVIAPSLARGLPATVPPPPMTTAAMLILRTQDSAFDFVSIFVTGCFRYVNFACGPYPDHAAWSPALLPIGFEIDDRCFVCRNSHFRLGVNTHVRGARPRQQAVSAPISAPSAPFPVNLRKQIRNTNEHFTKSPRNKALG
ncbi:hypothetical protein [Mesorhizobium sangaii]|uniref:Uncharacterized protein n=1 Tax=Mesorhizobium sangaii TaxID=505389 RepID=A0A841PRM1_9HYPH|nr:hypothetical protein [Mesorhizobium sangaii]MBB6412722.1 hypothetical protein [Mesorhizobium sangaii]